MWKMFSFFGMIFLLVACGTGNSSDSVNQNKPVAPLPPAESKVTDGDFIYRLATEKNMYKSSENLEIFAELIYVGEQDSIDIYHAASPFHFPLEERTRGFTIDYAMNEPLITSTLKKGEPLRQVYSFAGGYSETDKKEFVVFVKSLIDNEFPEGEYIIHGFADFYTADPADAINEENFNMKADIGFTISKSSGELLLLDSAEKPTKK